MREKNVFRKRKRIWRYAEFVAKSCENSLKFPKSNKLFIIQFIFKIHSLGGTDAAQGFTMEEALLLEKVGKSLAERESRQAREKAANGVPKLNEIPSPRPSEERRAQVDLPGML